MINPTVMISITMMIMMMMIFTMMLNISFMVSFRFMFVIEHPLASYKMRKVIKILLLRPSQLDKTEQNAHCRDKHLKQTHSLKRFT